ncbi:MAG: transcriptional regulator [Actinobacteria bacterium]|nr:transcriptional regulator [Actinomycetota bacterium]
MKPSNVWRLLKILLIICRYNGVKVDKISEELEISTRQVYRDIKCLEYAGIPIYSDRNGYSVTSNFFMSKISLNLPEVVTLLLFVNSVQVQKGTPYFQFLNTACEKIINALPMDLKKVILANKINGLVDFGLETKINYKEIESIFGSIYSAQLERKSVRIKYFSMEKKEVIERIVEPYTLKFRFGVWYLIGYCHLRKEIRTFRIDRIREIKVLDDEFSIPDDFSLDNFLEGSWGIKKGKRAKVKLRFSSKIAEFISEITWHPSQKLKSNKDRSLYAYYEVMGLDEIKRWILSFGADVEVIEPQELKVDLSKEIKNMNSMYEVH